MHDRLRLTHAKTADEVQLELLAPWYAGGFQVADRKLYNRVSDQLPPLTSFF
jgi:hypothetical protein